MNPEKKQVCWHSHTESETYTQAQRARTHIHTHTRARYTYIHTTCIDVHVRVILTKSGVVMIKLNEWQNKTTENWTVPRPSRYDYDYSRMNW